ncbi:hypothetical protein [Flavobacterium sp. I3-2]|uniref:hypothetical protein n=1 Tax=Flavobacterium sp. I3-2 TaxID=2748319 RepID=UPI0015AD4D3A|nr:hypothetical protein [Flavobacterium sp. I3-2]
MKLHEIQSCIADYQELIKNCSESDFKAYFENADYCDLVSKSFTSFPNDNINLFLGIKDSKLMGFLVNENIEYTDWTEETQIFESEFKAFTTAGYNAFKSFYEKKKRPDTSNAIECEVGFTRIETWSSEKSKWFLDHAATNKIVKYFEIPTEDYANGHGNTFNFGLLSDNQIDLIVGNPAGLYDISRPVPPFEPNF